VLLPFLPDAMPKRSEILKKIPLTCLAKPLDMLELFRRGSLMSELRLNVLDAGMAINGAIHGGEADAVVAALSAEPETIDELQDAVARFTKPIDDRRPFAAFAAGINGEPWDAGIIFIDLAARIVAAESSCSMPSAAGQVLYHDGVQATDVWLPYQVPEDWLFVDSIAQYEPARGRRRAERSAVQPLDVRPVLYGTVVEFIVEELLAARDSKVEEPIAAIHAKWLVTPTRICAGDRRGS
jgi:hypothetical protein